MASQKILVVVDPTAAEQPAVTRGLALCRSLGCDLELLICHYDSQFAGRDFLIATEREALREQSLRHQLGYLNSLREKMATDDIKVTIRAVWDKPLADALVRVALREEPRLVLKDTHHHSGIARTLFTITDWQLIRALPVPLWLVKKPEQQDTTVLAAVDPSHEHDKPASLDRTVLEQATAVAGREERQLHVYHGYDALTDIAKAGAFSLAPSPIPVTEINARVKTDHEQAFAELMTGQNLPPAQAHVLPGAPAEILPALAREINAGLVVMGAIARGPWERVAIGSTAERVLDQLPCDVLIVKPAGFVSPVTYKAQSADFLELSQ
ncbi:MAG: universal stress protein [Gammaproteobacteria bacterium]